MSAARPTLAATLIVRDEARCIARCLDSVRPFVDRIVVLDTGSGDDTVALALAGGAEVHRFVWCDDFAAARNRVLELADADWHLMLDADEWVAAGGDCLRDWIAGAGSGGGRLGQVCIHNAYDPPGGGAPATSRGWVTRLLPRGVRYAGRVHEQPVSDLPRARTALELGHDGYLGARIAAKRVRNRPLLLAELAARPGDGYVLFQLGRDADVAGEHGEAAEWYARAAAVTPPHASWRHELVVGWLHCLGQAGRAEEAMTVAQGEMAAFAESPDFFFTLGNLALDRAVADPARALGEWLPLAETAWERCLQIGERPELDGSVAGRGSFLAAHNLAVLRGELGALAAA